MAGAEVGICTRPSAALSESDRAVEDAGVMCMYVFTYVYIYIYIYTYIYIYIYREREIL